MTKELLQQALNKAKASAIEVFTYENGIAKSAHDAIEYMHSWLGVYFEKQALAQQEQPASVDAYVGAREDAAIWKKRALEAEELNRKFIAELNGPTYLGEPAQPAQKPDLWKTQFLTDVMTSAGLLRYGRTDKKLAQRIADGSARWRTELYTHHAPTQPALSDASIDAAIEAWFTTEIGGVKGHPFRNRMRAAIEAHCRGGANK